MLCPACEILPHPGQGGTRRKLTKKTFVSLGVEKASSSCGLSVFGLGNRIPFARIKTGTNLIGRKSNEKAQTRKQQSGSIGPRSRLHGAELWFRPRRRQAGGDFADSVRLRTRCDFL